MAIKIPIQYPLLGVLGGTVLIALFTSPMVARMNNVSSKGIQNSMDVLDSPTAQASAVRAQMSAYAKKVLQDEMPGGIVMSVSIPGNGGAPVPADFKIGDRVTVENQNGVAAADRLVVGSGGILGRTDSDGVISSPILSASGEPTTYLPRLNTNDPEVAKLIKIYNPLMESADARLGRTFVTPSETAGRLLPTYQPSPSPSPTYEAGINPAQPTIYQTVPQAGQSQVPGMAQPGTIPGTVAPTMPGGISPATPGGLTPATPGGLTPATPGGLTPATPGAIATPATPPTTAAPTAAPQMATPASPTAIPAPTPPDIVAPPPKAASPYTSIAPH
jgi:hypothetical protein